MHVFPDFMGTWFVCNWIHTLSDYLDQAWGKPILIILSRRSYLLSPEPHCAFRHHPHYCLHLLTGCHLRDSHSLLLEDSSSSRRGLMSSSEHEHDARAEDWSLCMTFVSVLWCFLFIDMAFMVLLSFHHREITERVKIKYEWDWFCSNPNLGLYFPLFTHNFVSLFMQTAVIFFIHFDLPIACISSFLPRPRSLFSAASNSTFLNPSSEERDNQILGNSPVVAP